MRQFVLLSSAAALVLVSCGPKKLALPADPIDSAATCAVVSAAAARQGATSIKGDLDYPAQTRIIHYAMLAGSEGKTFKAGDAAAVVAKMNDIAGKITEGKWQDLQVPCNEVYPLVAKTDGIELPAVKFDAQLGCYALADFMIRSVKSTGADAEARQASYSHMRQSLDPVVGAGLKARGAGNYEKVQDAKNEAFATFAKLGSPLTVMKLCTDKFG